MRRSLHVLAAAAALVGLPAVGAPAPASAAVQAQQDKGALPSVKVSRRQVREALASYGFGSIGGRAPWVNKHGGLLRHCSRPIHRKTYR